MKQSAGVLLYREGKTGLEVLLVHPSGNYNRRAAWSIPKGLIEDGEDHETAARRETLEETGLIAEELTSIGHIDYTKSRKRIHCFAGPTKVDSNAISPSWEVDQVEFHGVKKAKELIHADQAVFIDRLQQSLNN